MKPINKCLVSIESAFIDEIVTSSGFKLYLDPTYAKEWNACSVGVVKAISDSHSDEFNGLVGKLSVGDEIAFSYRVVGDFTFKGDGEQFIDTMPDSPETFKKYTNGQGFWVIVRALPKPSGIGKTWIGVYSNKINEIIDSIQGDEQAVSRWLSQFNIGKTDRYTFNNLIDVQGQELWKVPYSEIFAKKQKNGTIVGIGDRVLCQPLDIPLHRQVKEMYGLAIPEGSIQARWQDRATVVSNCKKLGLSKGDIIGFQPQFVEKYRLWDKEYYLVKHRRVDFLWSSSN